MGRGLFEPWHIILLVAVVAVLFGWKKLPDISRSVGRSMRIFKSEVSEMKNDGKDARPSAAAGDTVSGDVVPPKPAQPAQSAHPAPQAAQPQVAQPSATAPAYQPTPSPQNGQSAQAAQDAQDAEQRVADQQRHENPAL
ncbi:MAG: Sec-independent protein translocase subunit TatA [Lapillicoccus sp.]